MKKQTIRDLIQDFTSDVNLVYKGEDIFIDPLVRNKKYMLGYKDIDKEYSSVNDLMSDPVIDGKSINDICDEVTLL